MELARPKYDETIGAISVACQNMIEQELGVSVAASELAASIAQILSSK